MEGILREVTAQTFEDEVVNSTGLVVVDFWGPKCLHCLNLMPQYEDLALQYSGQIKFMKLDVSKNRRFCIRLKVMGLPAFILFKNGNEVERIIGNNTTIKEVEKSLNQIIKAC